MKAVHLFAIIPTIGASRKILLVCKKKKKKKKNDEILKVQV